MGMNISFKDQMVFVTGGTRGIGKSIVHELAACEADILFTGTGKTPPGWLTGLKNKHPGQKVDFHQLDFSKETWIKGLEEITANYPGIYV